MICYNCGIKLNSDNEKECRFCGVRFSVRCPSCGAPGPKTASFCLHCGGKLPRPDEQSSVENFETLEEGRKNVAVIFADISGFTALSEKMDPEEVREIVNECFNYITGPVYELEGSIDKYIGDCVMVLFGARHVHADDAGRAVMCALKMMELVEDYSRNMLSQKGVELKLSIGINFGLVVTGGVGNYFDRDYTVMGDIVNTAQRLQSNAGGGNILVSESVHAETSDMIEYSELRTVKARNRETPVRCYTPLGVLADRFAGWEETFLERQKEIGLLNSLYNDARNTGFRSANIIGEAGMGKTRLLREFVRKAGNDVKVVWTDCTTSSRNRSYSLLSSMLSGIMNINPTDSGNMRQHRLISFLDYILSGYSDEEIKRNYDFLGLVMGFERDAEFQGVFEAMSYDNVKREILKQLSLFFINLCRKQKLLVIIDDSQWADAVSFQLLNELAPAIREARVVFLFSSRYDNKPLGGRNVVDIRLASLTREAVAAIVCGILDCVGVENGLLDAIVGITKGNPLYVRELTAGIKRKKTYKITGGRVSLDEAEMANLPSSIQKLIASKISGLEEGSMRLLRAASVLGREFRLSLLNHILDNPADEAELSELSAQVGIIALKNVHTSSKTVDRVYVFVHDVEREVIYDGILNREKRGLHKKTAEYIEAEYRKNIEDYFELLGEHYSRAGMPAKAADYYYRTALKLKGRYSLPDALDYFAKYLEFSDKGASGADSRVSACYREIGHIHFINANYKAALENLEKACSLAVLEDDTNSIRLLTAEVYRDQGMHDAAMAVLDEMEQRLGEGNPLYGGWLQMKCNILRIQGDPSALGLARKSEKILLKAKDFRNLAETMKHAGMIFYSRGEIDNALTFMGKSFKYAEKNNLLDIMAKVSGDIGVIHHSTGMVSKAMEFLNMSMNISRKLSYRRGVTAAGINLGILYLDKGMFEMAEKLFNEALEVCREVNSKLYECISMTNLGDVEYELGDFKRSRQYFMESLELARSINAPIEEGANCIGLARVLIKTGEETEAEELLEKAHSIFKQTDETSYDADYFVYKGLLAQESGDYETALACYENAVVSADDSGYSKKKLKAYRFKGSLLLSTGRIAEADAIFMKAVALARDLDSEYETAKCWYGRYKAQMSANMPAEAFSSLDTAVSYINKVDKCRWREKIIREYSEYREKRNQIAQK